MSEEHPEQNEQESVEQPADHPPGTGDTGGANAEAGTEAPDEDREDVDHVAPGAVLSPDSPSYVTTTTTRTITTADEATTITTTRTEPYAGPVGASYPRPVG